MLKNKIVVRKIRNIVILLMAILIMIGAYKNIDRSRAENVIEIGAIAMDKYGCLENEEFALEAKEISDGLYEIEIPENINTKQVNQVIEVTLENKIQSDSSEETEAIEITDNKIYLTTEQIENNEIKFKTVYDVAITVIDEQGKYSKDLLSEMTEEEITEVKTMTSGEGLLYNRTLKYEENGKIVEVQGYMLEDVELDIQEVTQEQLSETYGEIQINSAYDIKTIRKIKNQGEQGTTTEIIQINPLDYGEVFEVLITDSKIQKNSDVYYLKDKDTCNQVEVNESAAGNIKFNMYYSGIYAVKQQHLSLFAESTIKDNLTNIGVNTQTTVNDTQTTASNGTSANTEYFIPASGTWIFDVTSNQIQISVSSSLNGGNLGYIYWSTTTTTPNTWNAVELNGDWYNCVTPLQAGTWYLHVKTVNGTTYYAGPYNLQQANSAGPSVYADISASYGVNGEYYVNVHAGSGTLSGSAVLADWKKHISGNISVGTDSSTRRTVTSTSNTTHKYYMGLPPNEFDSEGNSTILPQGEYYIAYKYWGQNSNGASVIGYARSPEYYYFDRRGPEISLMSFHTGDAFNYEWWNSDVTAYLSVNSGYLGINKVEWSEDEENWEDAEILYDVGTGTPQTSLGVTHKLTEERQRSDIYYRGTDEEGQVGEVFSLAIGIDKTNPTVSLELSTESAAETDYSKTKDIIITANDALSGVDDSKSSYQYYLSTSSTSLSGGEWQNYTNGEITTIGEGLTGTYYLFIKPVTDQAGNKSTTSYHTFGPYYFDNKPPTASTIKMGTSAGANDYADGTWTNKDIYLTLNNDASDEHSGLNSTKWKVNVTTISGTTKTLTDEGEYQVEVTTTDNAGNIGYNRYNIRIDKTAPNQPGTVTNSSAPNSTGQVTDSNNGEWTNQDVTISWSNPSDTGTYQSGFGYYGYSIYTNDDQQEVGSWTKVTEGQTNVSLTFSEEQDTNIAIWTYDKALNASSSYNPRPLIRIDKTSPTVTLAYSNEPKDWYNSALSTMITTADTGGSGIISSNYEWYLSNSATELNTGDWTGDTWTTNTSGTTLNIDPGKDGTYYIFVKRVNDNAGNVSTSNGTDQVVNSVTYHRYGPYKFDYTEPSVSLEQTTDTKDWYNAAISTQITTKDTGGSGITSNNYEWYLSNSETALNTGDWTGDTWTTNTSETVININPGKDGIYYLFVKTVNDNAGNISTSNGTDQVVNSVTYHKYGPYKFDYTKPTSGTLNMKLESSEGENYINESWTNNEVYIEVVNGEDQGTYQSGHKETLATIKKDGVTYQENVTSYTLTEEGIYTIIVKTTDKAGNDSDFSETYTVKIDETKPKSGTLNMKLDGPTGSDYTNAEWTNKNVYIEPVVGEDQGTYKSGPDTAIIVKIIKDGETYQEKVSSYTLTEEGIYEITVRTTDKAGNESALSETYIVNIDKTNPVWLYKDKEIYYSILNDVGNEDYANRERTVKIIFEGTDEGGRDVTSTLTAENITILVNGAPILDQALSVKTLETVNNDSSKVTCTLTLKGIIGDGDLTVVIPGATLTDKAGNKNGGQSLSTPINIDNTNPNLTLDIATPAGTYKANDKIIITATYNENIYKEITSNTLITTGNAPEMTLVFVNEQGNEIPSKGNVSCKQVNGNILTYEYIIQAADNVEGTNGDNGILKIKSLEQIYDAAGNSISGSEIESNIKADTIHPTIISITPDKTSPTNAENITYTVEFSEPVTGFETDDITVNSGKGTVTSVSGSGEVYYVTIKTKDNEEYTETITIDSGVCTDNAGNPNVGATSSGIVVDRIDPTLTITADKESPTNAENITYTLTFSENVTLSEVEKIIVNNSEESIEVSGNGTTYIVTVPTTDNQTYTQTINVNVGAFIDEAGNGNIATTSTEILIDRIEPTITVEPSSSTWTNTEISVEVTHNDDDGGSGITSTSGQYFLTTDESPTSTGTLSNYTSGTAFTINPEVSGEYYLYIKEISDNAGNKSNKSDNDVEINGVTYHKYGKYQFDYEKPIIEKVSSSKDSSNKTETIIFKVTDSLSGIANNLDVNNIIVKIDGESATAIAKPETPEQQEANKDSIWMEPTSSQETSNETTYTLVLSNFEQSTKIGGKMYKEWSGDVSIEIPASELQDNAGNNSEETPIDGEFVDYIKPVVENVSADNNVDGTNTQTIIFNVIDKYLNTSDLITLNEDKDGDGNADPELIVKIDGQEADITKTLSIVSKFVMNKETKTVSSQANDYVVQSTEQVIGQQYKLVLSDFEKTRPSGKYYKEWSGDVSIEILQDAVKDTSENKNDEKIIDGKFADFIKPEFTYEYSETTIGDGNHTGDKTLTVVFYAADKHFDVANSSLQLSDLTVTVGGETIVVNNSEETDVNKKNTLTAENLADGTGIKYTLVIRNLEQDPNDGYSYSGTVSITIPEGKIKDTSTTPIPNSNDGKTITIGIDDPTTGDGHNSAVIVDVVSPVWKVVNSTTGTNAQGRTTAEIELIATDKYFSVVKNTREELEGLIEIQVAGIDISDEAEELTKTLSEPTYINWNSENETYTTVEEEQANGVKYTLTIENLEETYEAFLSARANNERVYREYSGPVKIVIPAGTVEDDYGNLNKIFEHDLNHIDTLRPEVVEISSSVDTTAKTQTIIFDITDKYLNTSLINPTGLYGVISAEDNADISKINTSYIDVYVDEELTKIDTDLDGILDTETITKTIKNIERLTATVGTNTNQLVGYRYTLELSGFEQSEINSKNYKDWSGTVSIKINANIATDTNTPTANGNSEKTIVGKYVDFVNPHIQYTHQESDIDKDGKKYTMTFSITDKYYDETTSQPFTVQDIKDGNIEILIQNGQKDSNGNAIIYNLKDVLTESSITLESAEIRATDVKITNTSGEIETVESHLIGHTYTLTISDLEEAFITGTNKTANYSGVITVALPSNRIFDRQGNKNDGKTITSIVHLPEGGTTNVVDVVRPIFDKVSSSANAVNGTATITFKGTDTYFVENSTLSADDIQVYVDGEVSNITKNISNPVYLKENRLQFGTNTTIQDVQYGVQYTLTLSGFAQNVNQVKIRIPEGKLTDQYGNFNVDTDLIVYNTLKLENMDEIDSVGLNTTEIDEAMDAILTKPFLGESTGTTIYPKNSTLTPIARQDIQQIQFVNNLDNLLEGEIPKIWDTTEKEWNIKTGIQRVWDISAQGDKSILAWTSQTQAPYTVYVGSAYEIFGNQNSRYLLAGIGKGTSATATTTVVNLNALNTSSVTNMYGMFYKFGYTSMTSLDLGNFDTSNVTNMFGIFSNLGYTKMASFDLGENFNTSKVTNMEMMFNKCGYKALLSLSLGDKFNTSNVRNMFSIFAYCGYTKMTALNLGNKFNTSNVTDMTNMFFGTGCMSMTNLYFGAESESTGVIILPDNFNTSNVKRMGSMFSGFGLFKITSLDLGNNFDTSNVTDMNDMFNSCGGMSMTNLELGEKFDTSKVTDMSGMFSACGTMAMTSFDLGEKFDTSNVTDMSQMFMGFGQKITSFNLGNKFDTSNVTDMFRMFHSFGAKLTSFDLGDKFYTSKVTDMNFMFAYVGNESMTKLDLGPHFTNIPDGTITVTNSNGTTSTHDAHDRMFGHCGKEGELTIYAPESIYSSSTTLKLNSTSEVTITPETLNTQNGEVIGTRGTIINPIYKPEWEVISTNASEGTVTITVKGRAYENQTIDSNVAIKYAENVTSGLETGKVSIFIDDTYVTELTNPIVSEGITTTETVTVGTEQKTISIVTHTITLSNLDEADAVRITGIPYNEWAGKISLQIHGRGDDPSTYGANVLVDSNGNQNMMESIESGFVDFIKPEFRYESANTVIEGLPDIANQEDKEKVVKVVFDVLDKYYFGSTLSKDDITLKIIDPLPELTIDPEKISKELQLKTSDTETTDETSGLIYKTNGDIHFDVDGDGITERVGQRYELVIGNLDQGNGVTYSGPMSITFPAGKITDTSNNSNNATTITIGIDEIDGDPTTADGGEQQIIDLVNPVWEIEGTPSVSTVNGITSASITLITYDKYLGESSLSGLKVLVAEEDKTTDLNLTVTDKTETIKTITREDGTTETVPAHKYTISFTNFEETYAKFLEERAKYIADSSTGRLYREFSGTVKLVVPKGSTVDMKGNDSEEFEIDLGTIDTLKPEIVKVSSSVNEDEKSQTIVFDITDKNLESSLITTSDTSKIHVLIENKEADVTKTITNITELKAMINNEEKTIGYRYTLKLTEFNKARTSAVYGEYTNWSGHVSIKIDAGTAKDANGSENEETILPAETIPTPEGENRPVDINASQEDFVDFIKPDITYIYSESSQAEAGDIDYSGKTFKMVFEITDKYFANSTLEINDLTIQIDGEEPDWRNPGETTGVTRNLTSIDVKDTIDGVSDAVIGKRYTLVLSDLEQLQIQNGDQYLDYSGVITVAIPEGKVTDSTGNDKDTKALANDGTTITSGIDIPGGAVGDKETVDVVDPLWQKVSSSANAINKTAAIKIKGTDKFFENGVSLTSENIKSYIKVLAQTGTEGANATDITDSVNIEINDSLEQDVKATVNGVENVVVGKQYELTITGFEQNVNQIKIEIAEDTILDKSGNGNETTQLIVYNVLRLTNTETVESSMFIGSSGIERQNVEKVIFVDSLADAIEGKIPKIWDSTEKTWTYKSGIQKVWDVSAAQDDSILAWTSQTQAPYTVYIGSNFEMFANQDSSYLFAYIGYNSAKCTATETILYLDLLNTNSVINMSAMFSNTGYASMEKLNLGTLFNTTNVTKMNNMFENCGYTKMTNLYFGDENGETGEITFADSFDTSKVEDMSGMFKGFGYTKMQKLDLGNSFDTSNVKNMNNMFANCGYTLMTNLDLGNNFDTSNVEYMNNMFANCGHISMTTLDLSSGTGETNTTQFNTIKVKEMSGMFNSTGYELMTSLNLGNNFDTRNVIKMVSMFEKCGYTEMQSLDLGNKFYTTKVDDMSNMFNSCGAGKMEILDLGPLFTRIAETYENMFKDCGTTELKIYAPESIYSNRTTFK